MRRLVSQGGWAVLAVLLTTSAQAQLIIAHRGASHDAPENTLAAFREAWKQGADGIEADFYLSSDGKVVCFHDKDTQRVAGVKHVVKDTPFDVLRSLDVGAWKDARFRGERIPTFDEVAAIVPAGKTFFIELKTGPEIVAPLVEAIEASHLDRDNTVVISFQADTIAECERRMPDVKTYWLTGYKQPEKDGPWKPTREEVIASLDESHADGLGTQAERKVVDKAFLDALCDAGHCDFSVWTIDDVKTARFYKKLDAEAITTNRPGWLRAKLESRAQAVPAAAGK
jgi:glycerophosphoryl diester phosphodiesterase